MQTIQIFSEINKIQPTTETKKACLYVNRLKVFIYSTYFLLMLLIIYSCAKKFFM